MGGFRRTRDEFVECCNEVHGYKYGYDRFVELDYKNPKIWIECPIHGYFEQRVHDHLRGRGCFDCGRDTTAIKRRKDKDWFVCEARKVHGDRYDYSISDFVGYNKKLWINCLIHGPFEQTPGSHLHGTNCNKCGTIEGARKVTSNAEAFIVKAKLKHGDKYDYSCVEYVNSSIAVKIVCPIHGVFYQPPRDHLSGHGCRDCGFDGNMYRRSDWVTKAGNRLGKFYIIKCYNESECFYKYGITFTHLKLRYSGKASMPYKYEIVRLVISSDKDYIWELEKRFGLFKQHDRYNPLIKFQGHINECFSHFRTHKQTPIFVVDAPKKPKYLQMEFSFVA
jgi:hypothetical protein